MAIAEYRAVVPAETRCIRKLSSLTQLVMLHLRCLRFSTPTGCGVFELDILVSDCNADEAGVRASLTEAARRTIFRYSLDENGNGSFWIPWQLEHDPPPAIEANYIGHERRFAALPDSVEKACAVSAWKDWCKKTPAKPSSTGGRPTKTLPLAPDPDPTPDPDPKTSSVAVAPAPVKPPPAKREKPAAPEVPTLGQMTEWFGEWIADAAWQAEKCRAHWERDNFLRNGKPILNWKATCRTWAMNAIERGSKPVATTGPQPTIAPANDPNRIQGPKPRDLAAWLKSEGIS